MKHMKLHQHFFFTIHFGFAKAEAGTGMRDICYYTNRTIRNALPAPTQIMCFTVHNCVVHCFSTTLKQAHSEFVIIRQEVFLHVNYLYTCSRLFC